MDMGVLATLIVLLAFILEESPYTTMNEHASSSGSPPKTSTDADRSSDESASVPLEQELVAWGDGYQAWVDRNLQSLLKDFVTGKKSKIGVAMCPNTVTRCIAKEGTDENLRFILVSISDRQRSKFGVKLY